MNQRLSINKTAVWFLKKFAKKYFKFLYLLNNLKFHTMKKILYYSLFLLLPLSISAQTYTWQWAKAGGGDAAPSGSGISETQDELIRDVVVDSNNNSYYLTKIYPQNPNINGTPVTSYQGSDLLLFSLDCQGNLRWTRTIGGSGDNETAWKLNVDNTGGLYMMINVFNEADISSPSRISIRWDDTHIMPVANVVYNDNTTPDPGLNTSFLLKYNSATGNLDYAKPLQDPVPRSLRQSDNSVWCIDSNKNIHAILGFKAGTHLNGLITVPSSFTSEFQYYLVKFNYDGGNMTPELNPILLPITGSIRTGLQGKVQMNYDETLNRYYIAGSTSFTFQDYVPLSYAGTPLSDDGYVLAINGTNGNEVWRREFTTFVGPNPTVAPDEKIYSLLKDNTGNLYMSGRYYSGGTPSTFNGGSYSYSLPNSTIAALNYNYVMKLDSNGIVQWIKTPTSTDPNFFSVRSARARIALNGNEIAFVKGTIQNEIWDGFTITSPQNDSRNSLLVRLNKDTGAAINIHPIKSDYGSEDELTSIAVDNDGNYVMGGYFSTQIFTDPNDGIPTISYNANNKSQFYVAKLAKSACSPLSTTEVSVKETDMQFYPNPVEDVLNIKTKESLKTYEVISAVGQQVKRGTFTANNYSINMQGLTKGVYFVKVFTDKVSVVEKVVKK